MELYGTGPQPAAPPFLARKTPRQRDDRGRAAQSHLAPRTIGACRQIDHSPADRFAWHPEPDLLGFGDAAARPALERLGAEAWAAALDYLYDHAFVRAMGEPAGYAELREAFFGPTGEPGRSPARPDALRRRSSTSSGPASRRTSSTPITRAR